MENNKFISIKGLAHGSKRLLLLKTIMWLGLIGTFVPKLIRFNGLFSFSTLVIIIPLIVIGGLSLYTSYKDYVVFNKNGIIIDIENDKFIYPIKTTLWNLNQKNIREISLHSIFAISAKDNVVRKSDGKVRYYYNITIQSNEVDYPIGYSFYSSGNRDRLYSILKSVNGLD